MKISDLNLYGNNPAKNPSLLMTISPLSLLYIEQNDFLSLTGMEKKRLNLYLLRHKEIRILIGKNKKYLGLQEMIFYLAKLQRSEYGKKINNAGGK